MSVVHCKEVVGRDGSEDKLTSKRYTRTFQVLTSDRTDGAAIVLAHNELPQRGDTWQSVDADGIVTDVDLDAFCVNRRARQTNRDMPNDWEVTIEYAGRGDPTLEPPEIEIANARYQRAIQRDWFGVTVRNTAGEPFESGIVRDQTRFVVTIRQNVLTFDIVDAESYLDTTNEDTFLPIANPPGFAPGTCKITAMTAVAVWKENLTEIDYWKRAIVVEVDGDGWKTYVLNCGYRHMVDGVSYDIVRGSGKPKMPYLLDLDGNQLPEDGEPVYLEFTPYAPRSWSSLGLDWEE